MTLSPQFNACHPRDWNGRYARIPGNTTAFHIQRIQGEWWPTVQWETDGGTATCPMVESEGAETLAASVREGKRFFGYSSGGAFAINEFGQVLVPSPSGDGRRVMVGEWRGSLRFENSFEPGHVFDLAAADGLANGDPWECPYVGIPYNLSKADQLYFWKETDLRGSMEVPLRQDVVLIRRLRSIRSVGAVRFIVTAGGFALTKVPTGTGGVDGKWEPRYVGSIDYKQWFDKEH